MNQITQIFQELNSHMKHIMKGDFKLEEVSAAQRKFKDQIKLINDVVSVYGIGSKNKRRRKKWN